MSNDDITTKPTIETVLERINTLGQQLSSEAQALRADMQEVRDRQDKLQAELSSGLRRIERKLEILNNTFLTI